MNNMTAHFIVARKYVQCMQILSKIFWMTYYLILLWFNNNNNIIIIKYN